MNTLASPAINWSALLPLLIVAGGGVLGVLFEAFVPRKSRRMAQISLSVLVLAGAIIAIAARWSVLLSSKQALVVAVDTVTRQSPMGGLLGSGFVEDGFALGFQTLILIFALLSILVMADRTQTREGAFVANAATQPGSYEERLATEAGIEQTEIFPLALFATAGMMAFTSAFDTLTLFISLEVMSLPLYVLAATARRRRALSQEAAIKYFLLGAFSSAFFLMGAAMLYGYTGTTRLGGIATVLAKISGEPSMKSFNMLFVLGALLLLVGLLFKVGAVPFHSWVPDTYQGAPTPVTGFMAAGVKAAAFAAILRFVFTVNLAGLLQPEAKEVPQFAALKPVLWVIVILTILVGTVLGIVQGDVKRMLAYSSIAHAGFILIGAFAVTRMADAAAGVVFYLLAYGLASIGAFGIATLVRERGKDGEILGEANHLKSWEGLGRTNPVLATSMAIFLLSFAGIPFTAGFIGKFQVFMAGVGSGETVLVVIAVLASAATAFFYFRLIQLMFFRDPNPNTVVVASEGYTILVVIITAALTVLLGVLPGPVLGLVAKAAAVLL
ncbi:MAG: NADH-quinone oxidoreductase subunit NuoN [Actinomycetaceae bacterium]|nr:NADH-quinone oxidoreductase subunit NuoN [Actinomycetaceae bacterium]MDY6082698.1 NADH-quinone oxidoreductase subunit NuoN [Actinomycetaceae bacterium]